jgi:hypothetical protein
LPSGRSVTREDCCSNRFADPSGRVVRARGSWPLAAAGARRRNACCAAPGWLCLVHLLVCACKRAQGGNEIEVTYRQPRGHHGQAHRGRHRSRNRSAIRVPARSLDSDLAAAAGLRQGLSRSSVFGHQLRLRHAGSRRALSSQTRPSRRPSMPMSLHPLM